MSAIHALVLAAGMGSRFGGAKLLAPWRGGVLLDGALEAALTSPVQTVTLVTGADADAVASAARRRAGRRPLSIVNAPRFADGLSESLKAGIRSLPVDAQGVLVFLGDMPLVPAPVPLALVDALAAGALGCAPIHQGRRGNPAGLSRTLFDQVLSLEGDRGAARLLDALGADLVTIDTPDSGVLVDVDRPDDLVVITLS